VIFLSYSWRDQALAHEVDRRLRAAGHPVWIDCRDLRPGGDILEQLTDAISRCNILVSIPPAAQRETPWTRVEQMIARERGKVIVPIGHDPGSFADWMPPACGGVNGSRA
jgi:hypothetical protein